MYSLLIFFYGKQSVNGGFVFTYLPIFKNQKLNYMRDVAEIKSEIAHYKKLLKEPDCDFAAQTWIQIAIDGLRRELRNMKQSQKTLAAMQYLKK